MPASRIWCIGTARWRRPLRRFRAGEAGSVFRLSRRARTQQGGTRAGHRPARRWGYDRGANLRASHRSTLRLAFGACTRRDHAGCAAALAAQRGRHRRAACWTSVEPLAPPACGGRTRRQPQQHHRFAVRSSALAWCGRGGGHPAVVVLESRALPMIRQYTGGCWMTGAQRFRPAYIRSERQVAR